MHLPWLTCMPMRLPYWRSVILFIVGIHCDWSSFLFCLWVVVHTSDPSTFLFGVIALVYTLHLCHFCCCCCCRRLIDCHRVFALYSFDWKFVWDRSIVLMFLSTSPPFVFIVKTSIPSSIAILFLSWSCRCHCCGPMDRCFVLIVESYSLPTRLHHVRSIIRSFCLRVVRACVSVVVVVNNASSWFLFTFVRVSKYVVTLCCLSDIDITSLSGLIFTFVSESRYVAKIIFEILPSLVRSLRVLPHFVVFVRAECRVAPETLPRCVRYYCS